MSIVILATHLSTRHSQKSSPPDVIRKAASAVQMPPKIYKGGLRGRTKAQVSGPTIADVKDCDFCYARS
jgi:hypothetical protein